MNPARQLALEYITERIEPDSQVLELGAGSSPLAGILTALPCTVLAVDRSAQALLDAHNGAPIKYRSLVMDLAVTPWFWTDLDAWDYVTATYVLQHLLEDEAAAWREIRRVLKPGGKLLCTGRHAEGSPFRENGRADPLNAQNKMIVAGLGLASGLHMVDYRTYHYNEHGYWESSSEEANAFCATLEKRC